MNQIKSEIFDYVVIGAGVAALYLANHFPQNSRYLLIDRRDYVGGRIKAVDFHGSSVSLGAGVMRDTDVIGQGISKELGLVVGSEEQKWKLLEDPVYDGKPEEMLEKVKQVFMKNKDKVSKLNFTQFLNLYFDPEFVRGFISYAEYHDFLNADVEKTITQYPLRDLLIRNAKYHFIKGGWKELVNKLEEKIIPENIHLEEEVRVVRKKIEENPLIEVATNKNTYLTKKLFICGDITCKNIQFDKFNSSTITEINSLFQSVQSVPFMRIYTYHPDGHNVPLLRSSSIISRTIPINDKILMSAYTEYISSIYLRDLLSATIDRDDALMVINKLLKNIFNGSTYTITPATDFVCKTWKHGVHYYKPLGGDKIQTIFPSEGLFFCGEYVSDSQGWVEGALRSVSGVLSYV